MVRRDLNSQTAATLFKVTANTINKLKRDSIDLTQIGFDQLIRFGVALGYDITIEVSAARDIYATVGFRYCNVLKSENNE